jgi:hypothetical protein
VWRRAARMLGLVWFLVVDPYIVRMSKLVMLLSYR